MGYATAPFCYVLFDLLFRRGRALLKEPLVRRRELLRELLDQVKDPLLDYSDGIVGAGKEFIDKVVAEGQEGVMAKHYASRPTAS